MPDHWPGSAGLRTPTLKVRKLSAIWRGVEIFSNDLKVASSRSGFVIYNDIQSCVQWCRHAEEYVGTEMYRRLTQGTGKGTQE